MNNENDQLMPKLPALRSGEHKQRLELELMKAYIVERSSANVDTEGKPTNAKVGSGALTFSTVVQGATEGEAQRGFQEVKDAIANRRYRFIKEHEDFTGDREYFYVLTDSKGQESNYGTPIRLEDVKTWEQLQDRQRTHSLERYQQLLQAVAAGRARIVGDDLYLYHACTDTATGNKIEVMKLRLPDGKELAIVHASPLGSSKSSQTTSWQEHLDALATGKRQLLEAKAYPQFMYEYPLPDGSVAKNKSGWIKPPEAAK